MVRFISSTPCLWTNPAQAGVLLLLSKVKQRTFDAAHQKHVALYEGEGGLRAARDGRDDSPGVGHGLCQHRCRVRSVADMITKLCHEEGFADLRRTGE